MIVAEGQPTGVREFADAATPMLVFSHDAAELVWSNTAAEQSLGGRQGPGRIVLDRAMPALQRLRTVAGLAGEMKPIALTFWTPDGVRTYLGLCRRGPFGLTADALIVELHPPRGSAAVERRTTIEKNDAPQQCATGMALSTLETWSAAQRLRLDESGAADTDAASRGTETLREIARLIREGMVSETSQPEHPRADARAKLTRLVRTDTPPVERLDQQLPVRSADAEHLARITHELRTPLNAIIGFAEIMRDEHFGPVGNPKYAEYAGDIHRSAAHALSLVDHLLELSKLEAGLVRMEPEVLDLGKLISETVATFAPAASKAGVHLLVPTGGACPAVAADARAVRQIVLNLVANAVRCTPSGGAVWATVGAAADGKVVLRVQDTGVGMTPEQIEDALAADAVNRKRVLRAGGSGLGLPLTKVLAEANGATLHIEPVTGGGTAVLVVFPASVVKAAE
jgi:signal transduction histidine kinase